MKKILMTFLVFLPLLVMSQDDEDNNSITAGLGAGTINRAPSIDLQMHYCSGIVRVGYQLSITLNGIEPNILQLELGPVINKGRIEISPHVGFAVCNEYSELNSEHYSSRKWDYAISEGVYVDCITGDQTYVYIDASFVKIYTSVSIGVTYQFR